MKFTITLFCIAFSMILTAAAYVPGELLIQLNTSRNEQESAINDLIGDFPEINLSAPQLLSDRMKAWLLKFDNSLRSEQQAMDLLRAHPLIQAVQLNHYVEERVTYPNDPGFINQWALNNTGQTGGTPDADIDAPEAWDISTGGVTALGDTIVLAIIDSGNYLDHEDLSFWKNTLEIPDNGIDDDDNGYIDDYDGWNAVHHNGDITISSHGTHVSGIAAATGNNETGVAGINWNARIMPVRGSSSTESIVVEAYGYVLEMRSRYNETAGSEGAFVVATNASFGVNYGDPADFPIWCAMYDSLGMQGVLSCGATMNINANVDETGDMPTACDSDYLISVTNTTHDDLKNNGAAYGLTTIDLGAPGTNIYSTDLDNSYSNKTGTSMACPQVTGAIGLLFSAAPASFLENYQQHPSEYALLIKQYILDGVDSLECLAGLLVTGGRLNVFNSLQYFEPDPQQFEVSGHISESTTWEADTVFVVGDVWIDNNVILTIPAGTRIEFQDNYFISVQGTILAEGTESDVIHFTVSDTTGFSIPYLPDGGWGGLIFADVAEDNETSILSYCRFEYAKAIEDYQPADGACLKLTDTENVEINNCIFRNNYAGYGGSIYLERAPICLSNNLFEDNIAAFSGGAVFTTECDSLILQNNIFNNNLALRGGAVFASYTAVILEENEFSENISRFGQDAGGGALYCLESSASLSRNSFYSNLSALQGGALHFEGNGISASRLEKNLFSSNVSDQSGGAISMLNHSGAGIINNLILNSQADVGGAIMLTQAENTRIYNNTICGNNANYAAGLGCYDGSNANIKNNIFWENEAVHQGDQIVLSNVNATLSYNNIQSGQEGIQVGDSVFYFYEFNLASDPEFSEEGDHPYEITILSECINNGTPDTVGMSLPELDLAGNPRIYEGFVTSIDIGAYEYQGDNVDSEDDLVESIKDPGIICNYPNPFNPTTTILFSLNSELVENTALIIYNLKGQKVKKLTADIFRLDQADPEQEKRYAVIWDGTDDYSKPVPSGIYFSKLTTGSQSSFRKMVLMK